MIKTFTLEGEGFNVASADASAWDYWKREWLAYQAPWLQALDGSLVAPRCLGVGEGLIDDVLLGYLSRTSLANGLGALAPAITVVTNETLHADIEQAFGQPIGKIIGNVGATLDFEQQHLHQLWSLLPNASGPCL